MASDQGLYCFSMSHKEDIRFIVACIWVLRIQGICQSTSRDMGYYQFYFQGYGILFILLPGIWDNVFNISVYFQGYGIFMKINYWDICRDMGYLPLYFKG